MGNDPNNVEVCRMCQKNVDAYLLADREQPAVDPEEEFSEQHQRLALVVLQPGLELPHNVLLDLDVVDELCQHPHAFHRGEQRHFIRVAIRGGLVPEAVKT